MQLCEAMEAHDMIFIAEVVTLLERIEAWKRRVREDDGSLVAARGSGSG